MTSILDTTYLLDYEPNTPYSPLFDGQVQPTAEYNLNGDKATVCINIMNHCAEPTTRQKQAVFLLPALLRVVVSSQRAVTPTTWLDHVNALVGCPILTSGDVVLDDLPLEKQSVVMTSKLATILWLKEMITAYCDCEDKHIQYSVWYQMIYKIMMMVNDDDESQ